MQDETELGTDPAEVSCPKCHQTVTTRVDNEAFIGLRMDGLEYLMCIFSLLEYLSFCVSGSR